MKKLSLAVIALAVLSSAAFANNRSYELRDVQPFMGGLMTNTNALAIYTAHKSAAVSSEDAMTTRDDEQSH